MADRIRVEITGEGSDYSLATAKAARDTEQLGRKVRSENAQLATSFDSASRSSDGFSASIWRTNQNFQFFHHSVSLFKWPALIAGLGGAAQGVTALGAGVVGLVSALAPLTGALVAYPALLGAIGQAAGVISVAGIGDLTSAVGGLNSQLDKSSVYWKRLSPQAQAFAEQLQAMKAPLQDLQGTVQARLFGDLGDALSQVEGDMKPLQHVANLTADALGGIAKQAADLISSKGFGKDFQTIGAGNAQLLSRLGTTGLNFADALRHVLVAAQPLLNWMGKGLVTWSAWIDQQAKAGEQSGQLADFFGQTRDVMAQLIDIGGSLANVFFDIGTAAAPLGHDILDALQEGADQLQRWADSTEGQNSLEQFFANAKPVVFEMGRLVRDLTTNFLSLNNSMDLAPMIRQIRTELLPALTETIRSTTSAFGPPLIAALVQLGQLLGTLLGATGPLTLFVKAFTAGATVVNDLIRRFPILGDAITSAISVYGIYKLVGLLKDVGTAAVAAAAKIGLITVAEEGAAAAGAAAAVGTGAAGAAAGAGVAGGAAATLAGRSFAATGSGLLVPEGLAAAEGTAAATTFGTAFALALPAAIAAIGTFVHGGVLDTFKGEGATVGQDFGEQFVEQFGAQLPALIDEIRKSGLAGKAGPIIEQLVDLPSTTRSSEALDAVVQKIKETKAQIASMPGGIDPGLADSFDNLANKAQRAAHLTKFGEQVAQALNDSDGQVAKALDKIAAPIEHLPIRLQKPAEQSAQVQIDALVKGGVISNRKGEQFMAKLEATFKEHNNQISHDWGRTYMGIANGVSETISNLGNVVTDGLELIQGNTSKALEAYGVKALKFTLQHPKKVAGIASTAFGIIGSVIGQQRGGHINVGAPSGDTVPIMAEREEYMLNRNAVKAIGVDTLDRWNFGIAPRYQHGGAVKGEGRSGSASSASTAAGITRSYPMLSGDTDFVPALGQALSAMAQATHTAISVSSGFRTRAEQAALYASYLAGAGNLAAPPGTSVHETGYAADISPGSETFGGTVGRFGLGFTVPGESWHVELLNKAVSGAMGPALQKLARVIIDGPDGPLTEGAQGALDKAWHAASDYLAKQAATAMPAGAAAVSTAGAPTKGSPEQIGREMMLAAGWGASEWPALDSLWTQESNWNPNAVNPSSGAYGIPQALGHGHPYELGDVQAQIAWGLNYIRERYGSPSAAWAHEQAYNWYSAGGLIQAMAAGGKIGDAAKDLGMFLSTAYGPPWDAIEGGPETSQGTPLKKGERIIAVDPSVISYGSHIVAKPNPYDYMGTWLADDTGGAITGKHIDFFVGEGDGTKDTWNQQSHLWKLPHAIGNEMNASGSTSGGGSSAAGASNFKPGNGGPNEIARIIKQLKSDKLNKKGRADAEARLALLRKRKWKAEAKKHEGKRRRAGREIRDEGSMSPYPHLINEAIAASGLADERFGDLQNIDSLTDLPDLPSDQDLLGAGGQALLDAYNAAVDREAAEIKGEIVSASDLLLKEVLERNTEIAGLVAAGIRGKDVDHQEHQAEGDLGDVDDLIHAEERKQHPNQSLLRRLRLRRKDLASLVRDLKAAQGGIKTFTSNTVGNLVDLQGTDHDRQPISLEQIMSGYVDQIPLGRFGGQILGTQATLVALGKDYEAMTGEKIKMPAAEDNAAELAALQHEIDLDVIRDLRLQLGENAIFTNFFQGLQGLPYLGAFDHGIKNVRETGIALLHKGEDVVPDSDGPYVNSVGAGGGVASPQVTVYIDGDIAPLMGKVRAEIDGKVAKVDQQLGRRSRQMAVAPGR